jgi:hypothetical protein
MIDVQFPPEVALAIRELMPMASVSFNWGRRADIPVFLGGRRITINFRTTESTLLGIVNDLVLTSNTIEAERITAWAVAAKNSQDKIDHALDLIKQVVAAATTHQQVHRYMPELYLLIANEASVNKGTWASKRYLAVTEELKQVGSNRAVRLQLEEITLEERRDLKTLITHTLMFPPADGLGEGSPFHHTWIDDK